MKRLFYSIMTLFLTIGVLITVSYSWFTNTEFVEPELSGFSVSAYFGGGTGTADDPFLIKNPRHLYNLCWLQYLGYFNKEGELNDKGKIITTDEEGKKINKITQYSFSIEEDLPMSGWYLPPLGTTLNPFVGLLNGKGHTINNLTTTNNFEEFGTKHPSSITSQNFVNVDIIGFTGVIGKYSSMNLNDHSIEPDLNVIANIKLNETSVKTNTSKTLTGIVAGYINGTISDIGVVNSSLNIDSNSQKLDSSAVADISTYTVAGYATNDYLTAVKNTKTIVINPTTKQDHYVFASEGDVTGWGGSIDFLTLYNSLKTEWNYLVNTRNGMGGITYNTTKTVTIDSNGNKTSVEGNPVENLIATNSGTTAFQTNTYNVPSDLTPSKNNLLVKFFDIKKTTQISGESYKTSSYSLLIENATQNMQDTEWRYMCLTGYSNKTMLNAMTVTTKYPDALVISDGTDNYLSYNSINETITNKSNVNEATRWYLDSNNHLYFINQYSNKIYLNDNNGVISFSSEINAATVWNNTNEKMISNNYNNYLVYENENWKLKNTPSITLTGFTAYYRYNNNNYYITKPNNDVMPTSTNQDDAMILYKNADNYLYTIDNGIKKYFTTGNNRARSDYELETEFGISGVYYFKIGTNNKIYIENGRNGYTFYLYRSSTTSWYGNTSANAFTTTNRAQTIDFNIDFNDSPDVITKENSSFTTPDTYFPLNSENGVPISRNTGYIVSGSSYYEDIYADIRISAFPISDSLSNSGNANLSTVYTIDSTGQHTITNSSNYQKYTDSYKAVKNVLTSSENIDGTTGYVYGLHFMNAQIAMEYNNHQVRIPYAIINGQEYYNYQVPSDSIDFNLKEKGYINFFAGTYYQRTKNDNKTRNSCFFSLYDIFRSSSNVCDITGIKEIVAIYEHTNTSYSYVYKYSDDSYSIPFKYQVVNGIKTKVKLDGSTYNEYDRISLDTNTPSGYSLKFNTEWIKGHKDSQGVSTLTHNAAYYFEIPMNDGEYCLGSVPGHNGAYLMYLDIGANAQQINRTEISQKSTVTDNIHVFPKGISIILPETTIDANITNDVLNPSQSAVVRITNSTGLITLNRLSENQIRASTSMNIDSTYIPRTVSLLKNSSAMQATSIRTTTSIYSQIQYIDHNVTTGDIYETNIQAKRIDNGNPEYSYNIYKIGEADTIVNYTRTLIDQSSESPEWKLYVVVDNKNVLVDLTNASDTNATAIKSSLTTIAASTGTACLEYDYDTVTGATNTYSIHIDMSLNSSDLYYYVFAGDTITVTTSNTGGTTIYVTTRNTSYTFYMNGNVINASTISVAQAS